VDVGRYRLVVSRVGDGMGSNSLWFGMGTYNRDPGATTFHHSR